MVLIVIEVALTDPVEWVGFRLYPRCTSSNILRYPYMSALYLLISRTGYVVHYVECIDLFLSAGLLGDILVCPRTATSGFCCLRVPEVRSRPSDLWR